jgi:hypothetical protein
VAAIVPLELEAGGYSRSTALLNFPLLPKLVNHAPCGYS